MWSQRAAARDIKTRNRISRRGWRIGRLHARWQENKVNNVEWGSCPPSPLSDISRPFGDSLFPSDYLILTAAAVLAVYHLNSWGDDSGFSITPHTFCLLSSYRFSGFTPGICACNFLSTSNILFLLFKKTLATGLISEVKPGEWCQELTPGYCPGRCSSFKWSCFTQLSVLRAGRSLLPLSLLLIGLSPGHANLMLIFMFASSLERRTPASEAQYLKPMPSIVHSVSLC